jgi:hypothetical protein
MSNRVQEELDFDVDYDNNIDEEDFCFVIGPDGELKSVVLPEVLPFKTPKNISKILKMYGIVDPEQIAGDNSTSLH